MPQSTTQIEHTPAPFSFDGHGINDADGQRICKVTSCEPYVYPDGRPVRNTEFDRLSNLFATAPDMLALLQELAETVPMSIQQRTRVDTVIRKATQY